ncbi:hypothetical protein B0T13DRAFT_272110 [Neurospora crassa]|nr:hypothetical protein B0T13DRAFT_159469 [Neurospora crassa]KAK3498644.1 hypothetical protein B0T13DRAFT_272110 [Neurospora crassa]
MLTIFLYLLFFSFFFFPTCCAFVHSTARRRERSAAQYQRNPRSCFVDHEIPGSLSCRPRSMKLHYLATVAAIMHC